VTITGTVKFTRSLRRCSLFGRFCKTFSVKLARAAFTRCDTPVLRLPPGSTSIVGLKTHRGSEEITPRLESETVL
jgi:hypothetical protein